MTAFTLRGSTAEDEAFVYDLSHLTLRPHVEAIGRKWATARMHEKCAREAIDPEMRIVQVEGNDVGVYFLETQPTELWLHSMLLLPAFQRKGIGRMLLSGSLGKARALNVPLRLAVMRANPARAFYEAYGLSVYDEATEYFLMQTGGWKE